MSIYAGMTIAQKQAALSKALAAHINLSTGSLGESFSYTQGDGGKTVTFTRATLPNLKAMIDQLQQELGIIRRARRPIRLVYR
jgi:hypothetical protein